MIRNALFMAPMTTWSSSADLTVSNEELNYYERRLHRHGYVITGLAPRFCCAKGRNIRADFQC